MSRSPIPLPELSGVRTGEASDGVAHLDGFVVAESAQVRIGWVLRIILVKAEAIMVGTLSGFIKQNLGLDSHPHSIHRRHFYSKVLKQTKGQSWRYLGIL